jgi:flagellar hook-length control protein FliK
LKAEKNSLAPTSPQRDKAQDPSFAETLANRDRKPTSRPDRPEPGKAPNKTENRETETVRTNQDGERLVEKSKQPQAGAKAAPDKVESSKGKPNVSREQAMLQFMDSMESEFSIPSASIVEAMAELPADAQALSPTDTASQVIEQLSDEFGLSKEEQERAMQLYSGLLQNLNTLPRQAAPMLEGQMSQATAAGLAGTGLGAAALSSRDRRHILNNSLDKMNDKFFMHGQNAALPQLPSSDSILEVPKGRSGLEAYQNMKADGMSSLDALRGPQSELLTRSVQDAPMSAAEAMKAQAAYGQAQAPAAEGGYDGMAKALAALGAAAAALDEVIIPTEMGTAQSAPDLANINGMPLPTAMNAKMGQDLQFSQNAGSGFLGEGEEEFGEFSANERGDFKVPEIALGRDSLPRAETVAGAGLGAKALSGETLTGTAERANNIQQLMSQANYMIKNGGGEAKIILNPEGLGQVHLKVVVDAGKVDIQMQADTHEAKKLLESSLGDLKQALGQRNLNLEGLKVDVGSQTSNDTGKQNSQSQMNFQGDANRDQAQKFLSNFRDENFARRAGDWEAPGGRPYKTPTADPLQPATSAARRYQGQQKGKSIDRVA